ncbi:MAG: radical SAM protein [Desulfurococcales archaeon]|nr:radical SAM protein [Desulfurococcales archaeon]
MGGVGLFSEYNVFLPKRGNRVVKVALVYPSTYQASITNLFTHIAYYYLYNKLGVDRVLVDRFTLDNMSTGAITGLPLRKFDVALISIGFELDIVNFVEMLIENRISLLKKDRSTGPIIVAGGPPLVANPEPVVDFVDAVFIGDGEVLLEKLGEVLEECGNDRPCILDSMSSIKESVYTGEENLVTKSVVSNLDDAFFPTHQIRSAKIQPVYGEGYYIEVSRGCRWLCPFCMESYVAHPPRHRSISKLRELISEGLSNLKTRRVVLYSLSFFDYLKSDELLEWLINSGCSFSLPSIRYDTLSRDRIDLIASGGQRTITVAPETPYPNLSCKLHKCFNLKDLMDLCTYVIKRKLNLKLYFMLGVPGEEKSEVGIVEFVRGIVSSTKLVRKEQVRVAINPLVPKAHTPMQYFPLINETEYKRKTNYIRRELSRLGVRVSTYDWKWAFAQALVGLAGREISKLLITWALRGKGLGSLRAAIKEVNYDFSYVFERKDLNHEFPWSRIVLGLENLIKGEASALLD